MIHSDPRKEKDSSLSSRGYPETGSSALTLVATPSSGAVPPAPVPLKSRPPLEAFFPAESETLDLTVCLAVPTDTTQGSGSRESSIHLTGVLKAIENAMPTAEMLVVSVGPYVAVKRDLLAAVVSIIC